VGSPIYSEFTCAIRREGEIIRRIIVETEQFGNLAAGQSNSEAKNKEDAQSCNEWHGWVMPFFAIPTEDRGGRGSNPIITAFGFDIVPESVCLAIWQVVRQS
jgi:hypothetical protein